MLKNSVSFEVIPIKIALISSNKTKFEKVYTSEILNELKKYGQISPRICRENLEDNSEFLKNCDVIFSTWGMINFTEEEIRKYMPNVKALFYSAGSVQSFAKPFLNCGIRVFSAYKANAVPVAEYTFSQIVLAMKGFFQSSKNYKLSPLMSLAHSQKCNGNFKAKVGLIGLGAIGTMVAERLKSLDVEVLAYDAFACEETADKLNVNLVSLETVFSECDVISNHLANKKELKNFLNGKHFKLMKEYSVFINTGRGEQVDEFALAKNLILHPSRTAVLDVLKRETIPYINPLFWCRNAIITPHIAGSMGREVERMAYYMIDDFQKFLDGKNTQYEIVEEMLETMA